MTHDNLSQRIDFRFRRCAIADEAHGGHFWDFDHFELSLWIVMANEGLNRREAQVPDVVPEQAVAGGDNWRLAVWMHWRRWSSPGGDSSSWGCGGDLGSLASARGAVSISLECWPNGPRLTPNQRLLCEFGASALVNDVASPLRP